MQKLHTNYIISKFMKTINDQDLKVRHPDSVGGKFERKIGDELYVIEATSDVKMRHFVMKSKSYGRETTYDQMKFGPNPGRNLQFLPSELN